MTNLQKDDCGGRSGYHDGFHNGNNHLINKNNMLLCNGDSNGIIEVLSRVLTQLIDLNRNVSTQHHVITKFQSSYPPSISILAYLERINKYAKCSPNCFIVSLIYIDRLIETRNVILTTLNVHRLLITSVMLATKMFDDEFYKNAYYAKLGGVTAQEMNSLELEFLELMNFDFFVTLETFEKYQKELIDFDISPTGGLSVEKSELLEQQALEMGTFKSPSPPILMSCGQYKVVPSCNESQGQFFGNFGQNPGNDVSMGMSVDVGMSSVVVPLTYDHQFDNDCFGNATPPPTFVAPMMHDVKNTMHQRNYFSGQSQLEQHPQPQQMPYSNSHVGGNDMFPHRQQGPFGHLMNGVVPPSQGFCPHSTIYGNGSGGYVNPVTTPTSVADQVFSWGGNVGVNGGHGGDTFGVKKPGSGPVGIQQQQQHMMMNLHKPTQLCPMNYYHPASTAMPHGGNQPFSSPFQPEHVNSHFVSPHSSASYDQGGGSQRYYYPPSFPSVQQHPVPAFSNSTNPPHYQKHFKVSTGGGMGGRSGWSGYR